jgi:hypothetical protein
MLSFAEVNESIGPLIKSVIGMVNDVRNFLMLALATVLGFSFGFFALLSEQERQYLKNGGVEADDSGPRIDRFSEVNQAAAHRSGTLWIAYGSLAHSASHLCGTAWPGPCTSR